MNPFRRDRVESPLKEAMASVGMLCENSLHFLSFRHLPVKSDSICKRAPEIDAKTVFSAWFRAHLLTAIAEGPKIHNKTVLEAARGMREIGQKPVFFSPITAGFREFPFMDDHAFIRLMVLERFVAAGY